MIFKKLVLKDAFEVILDLNEDPRGFFARLFCKKEMRLKKINTNIVQINNSFSKKKGTTRGFHFQKDKFAESKIIRCINGKLINIIIDLRRKSPSFCKHTSIILDSKKRNMSVVPIGFANSIQTLSDNTEMMYFSSNYYNKKYERGIMWNDPFFNISWPMKPTVISLKDSKHKPFEDNFNKLVF